MDFDLASKHKREVDQRRKEAKRKLDQQRRDDEVRATMEQEHRAREEIRLREAEEERLRAEREALLNDGIRYLARLRPYPVSRTDDKLELPPSALEELIRQGAVERGELLTFAVGLGLAGTHAGVAEFTAEEGTVGVPPRVALCLTKGSGLDSLQAVEQVEVRYVRLSRVAKSRVKFQPRGQGFHAGGLKSIKMDLEHVLQETLRGHTALTEGDWLPIRHAGYTYELVVRELEPESSLALLDTDLSVEVLPSEQTEAELKAEEERKAREEAAAREAELREQLRLDRARLKAAALAPEPDAGPEVVQLLLRLPDGGRLQRRFPRASKLEEVLCWVESEPSSLVEPELFRLVQKWPGHSRELGPAEADRQLLELGFGRQEALFLQRQGASAELEAEVEAEAQPVAQPVDVAGEEVRAGPSRGGAWSAAEERAHEALDRRLEGDTTPTAHAAQEPTLAELPASEVVAVFERLVALGMPPKEAAAAAKRFGAQLKELGNMGFENWVEAVELLDRYNGRLLRVANLLSERAVEGGDLAFPVAQRQAPRAQAPLAPLAPAVPEKEALPKEVVAAKFRELIAQGLGPNEAATMAIRLVRESMAPAAVPAPVPAPSAALPQEAPVQEKLKELASMGFVDEGRNRQLLQKYAGRLERVIEALCTAD